MDNLVFDKNKLIVSFKSKDEEQIDFESIVNPFGLSVEMWLKKIEEIMKITMYKKINESIES